MTVSAAAGSRVQSDDMIVTIHQRFSQVGARVPVVSSGPENSGNAVWVLRGLGGVAVHLLEEKMMLWQSRPGFGHTIPLLDAGADIPLVSAALQRLVKSGAFGGEALPLAMGPDDECALAMQALHKGGFVDHLGRQTSLGPGLQPGAPQDLWILNAVGLAHLQSCKELVDPTSVASWSSDLLLEDQTCYQLPNSLHTQGGRMGVVPSEDLVSLVNHRRKAILVLPRDCSCPPWSWRCGHHSAWAPEEIL